MGILVWPAVVLIIAVFFLLYYKKPLERLLDRTSKITKGGLETSASATTQETSIERVRSGAEELLAPFENNLLVEQETLIRQELDVRHIDNPTERERVLVRHLASVYIYNRFERSYNLIFGSQISLLQQLNSTQLSREDAKAHYDFAALIEPVFYADYSFDQWLHFLGSQTLVRVDGDIVNITVAGREFLKFMIQEGYSFTKQG